MAAPAWLVGWLSVRACVRAVSSAPPVRPPALVELRRRALRGTDLILPRARRLASATCASATCASALWPTMLAVVAVVVVGAAIVARRTR